MCGIAGVINFDGAPVHREDLSVLERPLISRGPDDSGVWFNPSRNIALLHRRLAVLDLSHDGHQPMAREGRVIVFNGEIYNFKDLKAQLRRKGYSFKSESDTEVLLCLFDLYGPRLTEHIRGMYAFVVWDSNSDKLFLFRDPLGIKPLYWMRYDNGFIFSSQVRSLQPFVRNSNLEPAAVVGFHLWGSVPEPWTIFSEIKSLPSGAMLEIDLSGTMVVREFASINEVLSKTSASKEITTEELIEFVSEKLAETIDLHLISDVEVGLFLSAGNDSTLVADVAARNGQRLRGFTLGFEEFQNRDVDETSAASWVAKELGLEHSTHFFSPEEFEALRDQFFNDMDQPTIDGFNTWCISRFVSQQNLKVAISGVGADEIFGSYPSFRHIPMINRLTNAAGPLKKLAKPFRQVFSNAPFANRLPKHISTLEFGGSIAEAYFLKRSVTLPWQLEHALDRDTVEEGLYKLQMIADLDLILRDIDGDASSIAALELSMYMKNQLLRDSDWAGMAHSLEIRVPFADWFFFLDMAPHLKKLHEIGKAEIFSRVASRISGEFFFRKKTGFATPMKNWLLAQNDQGQSSFAWSNSIMNNGWWASDQHDHR